MKLHTLAAIAVFTFSSSVFAVSASLSKAEFCSDRQDDRYTQELLGSSENMLSFTNHGGLANGGVCWWHSRFTRNATYIAIYRPELPRPSEAQAKKLVKAIRKAKDIVIIPGYSNLSEFSKDFYPQIQDEIERWQKGDGVLRQQWIVGLAGSTRTSAEDLENKMDELYQYVAVEGNVAYQKLQLPSVVAHSWLVTGMEKTNNGYELTVVDSNMPAPYTVNYSIGMTNFNYFGQPFVPYLERERELRSLQSVIEKNCR